MRDVRIVGAGPAGSAAAIAALGAGVSVQIGEKSRTAKHKVCGEFIPAEAAPVLEHLGVLEKFLSRKPARISRCALYSGRRLKQWRLEESGFGLSRLELDRLLLESAVSSGADLKRGQQVQTEEARCRSIVLASGRHNLATRGQRLVGFKAHFEGPAYDGVELYFSRWGYVGVNSVEDNWTNVCGIAHEDGLRAFGFEIDEYLVSTHSALAARVSPLSRIMPWLSVCPLVFSSVPRVQVPGEYVYRAGDALGFVDPFTGSGILNALLTGRLAGIAAAGLKSPQEHAQACRQQLARPFAIAQLLRAAVDAGLSPLLSIIPGSWLYRLTRPQMLA